VRVIDASISAGYCATTVGATRSELLIKRHLTWQSRVTQKRQNHFFEMLHLLNKRSRVVARQSSATGAALATTRLFTRAADPRSCSQSSVLFSGMIQREPGTRSPSIELLSRPSAVQVVQTSRSKHRTGKSTIATIIGVALALFGASGVLVKLQTP